LEASPIGQSQEAESNDNPEVCHDGRHPNAHPPASVTTDWPGTTCLGRSCLGRSCLKWGDGSAQRQAVQAAATTDDVAQIAGILGDAFSCAEALRLSGQKVGRVTVTKQDISDAAIRWNQLRSIEAAVPRLVSL
jgi:hypothetical protein